MPPGTSAAPSSPPDAAPRCGGWTIRRGPDSRSAAAPGHGTRTPGRSAPPRRPPGPDGRPARPPCTPGASAPACADARAAPARAWPAPAAKSPRYRGRCPARRCAGRSSPRRPPRRRGAAGASPHPRPAGSRRWPRAWRPRDSRARAAARCRCGRYARSPPAARPVRIPARTVPCATGRAGAAAARKCPACSPS